tara:strand:+ start:809 stop:1030 length:222 start_codon:yes stop_codon:yes gene_type:complete
MMPHYMKVKPMKLDFEIQSRGEYIQALLKVYIVARDQPDLRPCIGSPTHCEAIEAIFDEMGILDRLESYLEIM